MGIKFKISRKDIKQRDTWIRESWQYNGAGFHKDKKKEKAKYAARKSKSN